MSAPFRPAPALAAVTALWTCKFGRRTDRPLDLVAARRDLIRPVPYPPEDSTMPSFGGESWTTWRFCSPSFAECNNHQLSMDGFCAHRTRDALWLTLARSLHVHRHGTKDALVASLTRRERWSSATRLLAVSVTSEPVDLFWRRQPIVCRHAACLRKEEATCKKRPRGY